MTIPSPLEPAANETGRGTAQHTAHVIALSELQEQAAAGRDTLPAERDNPLHRVRARLSVCVGEATLTLGELLSAKEQQVLVLDHAVDQPVDLLLEGQVVARGELVAVDEQFAVRIVQLPLPLKP